MEKLMRAFIEGFALGWKLFWSPLLGAYRELIAATNRPKPANVKEWLINSITIFFSPLTGAIMGFWTAMVEENQRRRKK